MTNENARVSKATLRYETKQNNFRIIAGLIDKYDPQIRKRKLSNLDALSGIMFMKYLKSCGYSTLAKRFILWNENNILEKVWSEITQEYTIWQSFVYPPIL